MTNGASVNDRVKVVSIADWKRIKDAQSKAAYEAAKPITLKVRAA